MTSTKLESRAETRHSPRSRSHGLRPPSRIRRAEERAAPVRGGTIQVYDGNGAWKQDFVYGEGIDQILMLQQADILDHDNDQDTSELARHYYHRNALGSVMEITDPLQAVAVSYRYDPYGKATITRGGQVQSSDPLGQHVSFTARWLDEETGLYYYRARMYSAVLGAILSAGSSGVFDCSFALRVLRVFARLLERSAWLESAVLRGFSRSGGIGHGCRVADWQSLLPLPSYLEL